MQRKVFKNEMNRAPECEEKESSSQSNSSNNSESEDESPVEKFRRGCDLPSDLDMGSNSENSSDPNDNEGDDGDWNMMGAALEREFLGLDWYWFVLKQFFFIIKYTKCMERSEFYLFCFSKSDQWSIYVYSYNR